MSFSQAFLDANGKPLELAGDHMVFTEDDEGTAHITFDGKNTGRRCGDCQLCCRLVPVQALHKASGEKCRFARVGKGCTIYPDRPLDCRTWSCRWLADPTTAGLPRPDRAHYVIDLEYDYVTTINDAGEPVHTQVLQVWCDPKFPHAWDTKPLRTFMEALAAKWRCATIIRWGSFRAITVFPPPLCSDGKWHIIRGGSVVPRTPQERQVVNDGLRFEPDAGSGREAVTLRLTTMPATAPWAVTVETTEDAR